MENLLITWPEDCNQKQIPIGINNIMVKALSLFSSLKENQIERGFHDILWEQRVVSKV
jgi:hypothetical protein